MDHVVVPHVGHRWTRVFFFFENHFTRKRKEVTVERYVGWTISCTQYTSFKKKEALYFFSIVENKARYYSVYQFRSLFDFSFRSGDWKKRHKTILFEVTTAMSRTLPVLYPIIHLWERRFLNPASVFCLFHRRLRRRACTMCLAKFSYDFSMIRTSFTKILSVYCCEESFI